jgi:HlyD family secretion protein
MNRKIFISIILLAALLVSTGLTACSGTGSGGVTTQQVAVTRGDLVVSVSGDGRIASSQEARLTFSSGGKVNKIAVHEGDKVKTGDVVAALDTTSLQFAVQQAQMTVTQAEGTLMQAQLAQKSAENTLDNLKNSGNSLKLALLNAQIARDTVQISLNAGIAAVDFTAADAALNRAKSYYDYVQRQLQQVTTNVDTWLLALDNAKKSLDAAQAAYDNALAGYDSNQVNLKKNQLQAAELSVTLAQKNIDDLPKNVALQEMQVASAAQTVKQAQQALDVARQSLADAQKQLKDAVIYAPFDGVVAAVMVKEGDTVTSPTLAPTAIVQMVNPAALELVIDVDEIDIPSVKLGQEAAVKVEALSGTTFKGRVTALYPVPIEKGGIVLYSVKLGLDVPESSGLKVGMTATADITVAKKPDVLIVPSRAVTKNSQGQTVVKVKTSDKSTSEKVVVVGLDDGAQAEIMSGLNEGDTVIVQVKLKTSSGSGLFGG